VKLDGIRINSRFNDIQKAIERINDFKKTEKEMFLSKEDHIHIVRSHLLIAIEAVIGICADRKLKRAVTDYSSCFHLLQRNNLLSKDLSDHLIKLVGLRNKMVHRYEEIDYGFVYDHFDSITGNLQKLIDEVPD